MDVLIVYDSFYGNTEKIARAIGESIGSARVIRPEAFDPGDLKAGDLLIVGSPTQGGRPTKPLQEFLDGIPKLAIEGVGVAAFDTRFSTKWVKMFGYAAEKIAASLQEKGGKLVIPAGSFFVKSEKGPLLDGESERSAAWAKEILDRSSRV